MAVDYDLPRPKGGQAENYLKPSQFISITSQSKHPKEAAMFIDFMRYRLREIDEGWQFESVDGHFTNWHREGVVLEANTQLDPGMTYIITHQELDRGTCRMVTTESPIELATACQPTLPGAVVAPPYSYEPGHD